MSLRPAWLASKSFDKVRFTRLLRDGGLGLGEAVDLTDRLLADHEIVVRLAQFDDRQAAAAELFDIGVAKATRPAIQCDADERVRDVRIDADTLSVARMDGRTISVPLTQVPETALCNTHAARVPSQSALAEA